MAATISKSPPSIKVPNPLSPSSITPMFSSSLRRSRFLKDKDLILPPAMDAEVESRSNTQGSTDLGEYKADLRIKRLWSEQLELIKVSDEDFQRNVYSNYSACVRKFEHLRHGSLGFLPRKQASCHHDNELSTQ